MDAIIRFFTDLTVGRKLLLGFGVVLLLTLAVGITGFYVVDDTVERTEQMNQLSRINASILQARAEERRYALSRDPASAEKLRQELAALGSELEGLASRASAEERASLQRIREAVSAYSAQFESYVKQLAEGEKLRAQMGESAELSRDEFVSVELAMYDAVRVLRLQGDHLKGSDPLTLAEATSGLTKNILDLRTFEYRFLGDGSAEALQGWQDVYGQIVNTGEGLQRWLDDEQKEAMTAALGALGQYKQAFEQFQRYRGERIASEQTMDEKAAAAVQIAADGLQRANEAMQAARQQTLALLGIIVAAAIAIGLVASVSITRIIVGPLQRTVAIAQRVAGGDLSQSETVRRRDEVGQLQEAMQTMTQSLRNLIGRIGGGVSQIATAADQLSAVTAQTSQGVQTQRVETDQVATAVLQMSSTVQEVARNAEQASVAARQADQEARQGDRVVQEAVTQVAAWPARSSSLPRRSRLSTRRAAASAPCWK